MTVECFPIADKITSLPGQPKVAFQQFAGYITVDEKQQRALFYYFIEAKAEPASKPLVLWLTGGIFVPLTCISWLTQQTLKLLYIS
jgi:serine carboxypeptidase-like clade 2